MAGMNNPTINQDKIEKPNYPNPKLWRTQIPNITRTMKYKETQLYKSHTLINPCTNGWKEWLLHHSQSNTGWWMVGMIAWILVYHQWRSIFFIIQRHIQVNSQKKLLPFQVNSTQIPKAYLSPRRRLPCVWRQRTWLIWSQ